MSLDQDELERLRSEYFAISGLLAAAMYSLITSEIDDESMEHAKALAELSRGVNESVALRAYVKANGGRDNYDRYLGRGFA